jgi:hypothetical protein
MGKMSADQKLIEEISGRKYEVDGPYGHEIVTPDDFTLKISEELYGTNFIFNYELFRKRKYLDSPILKDYHISKQCPILDIVNPTEVRQRYRKKAKIFFKQVVRREKLKAYLPDDLINDIVELFFIRGNVKRYGSV